MARRLVIVYGANAGGRSRLAWTLARSFDDKTAVVSAEGLLGGAIAVSDSDQRAELDMAHTQLRLLVANYLKNGYNVVVEGAFAFERDGIVLSYEAEIDQLLALMRNLAASNAVVRLKPAAGDDGLRRLDAVYKDRSGVRSFSFEADANEAMAIDALSRALREAPARP